MVLQINKRKLFIGNSFCNLLNLEKVIPVFKVFILILNKFSITSMRL